MKFRAGCFSLFALLALGWILLGYMATQEAYKQTIASTPLPGVNSSANSAAFKAGAAIGSGLGLSFFACTGLPLFTIFALLAWRNNAGLATERRHQQQLAVLQSAAQAQVAQAQLQYVNMQQQFGQPGLSTGVAPNIAPTPQPPMSIEIRQHMEHAKELIQKKDYKAARRLLERINHPKAIEWLAKLPQ